MCGHQAKLRWDLSQLYIVGHALYTIISEQSCVGQALPPGKLGWGGSHGPFQPTPTSISRRRVNSSDKRLTVFVPKQWLFAWCKQSTLKLQGLGESNQLLWLDAGQMICSMQPSWWLPQWLSFFYLGALSWQNALLRQYIHCWDQSGSSFSIMSGPQLFSMFWCDPASSSIYVAMNHFVHSWLLSPPSNVSQFEKRGHFKQLFIPRY